MKNLPAANAHAVFQGGDDFFESLAGERSSIEKQKREMAQRVARGIAREDGVSLNFGQEFLRVVVKDRLQEIGESAAFSNLRTEKGGGAFAPGELRGRGITGEPALCAQNFHNIAGRKSVCVGGWRGRIRSFLRRHHGN